MPSMDRATLEPITLEDVSSVEAVTEQVTPAPAVETLERAAPPSDRLASIDIVRGLVIVLMVLDHTRDFLSSSDVTPTDLTRTTPVLFLTRWITHFCASTFIFLSGTSAHLMSRRLPLPLLRRFLVKRGLWLIALEFTVVNFAWSFNLSYRMGLVMQVIWAIGASMCVLSALTFLSRRAILVIGLLLVFGHNVLDPISPKLFGAWAPLWNMLHVQGPTPFGLVHYPLIPWIGVMALGYCAGRLFELGPAERRRLLLALGAGACALFGVLRAINVYGDPKPWSLQPRAVFSLLSFLNVSKYPPSLAYVLVTLGPMLVALALVERARGPVAAALRTVGRVPLFAYVLHLFMVHLLAGVLGMLRGHGTATLTQFFVFYPRGWGYGLGAVYIAWAGVLLLLYPACVWFGNVKRERKRWWLAYL